MKSCNIYKVILLLLAGIFLYSCDDSTSPSDGDTLRGSGKIITEERTVDECQQVKLINTGNITVTQGSEQKVTVRADDNIIDRVEVYKENGFLVAGLKKGSYEDVTMEVNVTLKNHRKNVIEGIGNITCSAIESDSIRNIINGIGNIILQGKGDFVCATINGTGNIEAAGYTASIGTTAINGKGNIEVNVSEELIATINGTGNITYYGNPGKVIPTIRGTGQIIPGN